MKNPVRPALVLALVASIAGCASQAPRPASGSSVPPTVIEPVYIYPAAGQSALQLDRDRYECHMWSVKQSGFDPSRPHPGLRQHVEVRAGPPPGSATLGGAVAGAVIGAAVAGPHDSGSGAAVGALAGAAIGAASEGASAQREATASRGSRQIERLERRASDYHRAISACLEARSYSVK